MSQKFDTQWFRGKLADAKIDQKQLAKKLGLDPAAVSLMFRSRRRMQLSEAAEIAKVIGVPMNDVLSRAGIAAPEGPKSVPVIGWGFI